MDTNAVQRHRNIILDCLRDGDISIRRSNVGKCAVGLGLCTFANIASEEMSRDLANEIEKLLGSSNTYIRKKVCIENNGQDLL